MSNAREVAVLAGGCFWGVQGVFQHVDGVVSAVSGYAGSGTTTAHYDMTSRATRAMQKSFQDQAVRSGQDQLDNAADISRSPTTPTELKPAGPQRGRSTAPPVFPMSAARADVATSCAPG